MLLVGKPDKLYKLVERLYVRSANDITKMWEMGARTGDVTRWEVMCLDKEKKC